jgi:hypothetical protein
MLFMHILHKVPSASNLTWFPEVGNHVGAFVANLSPPSLHDAKPHIPSTILKMSLLFKH